MTILTWDTSGQGKIERSSHTPSFPTDKAVVKVYLTPSLTQHHCTEVVTSNHDPLRALHPPRNGVGGRKTIYASVPPPAAAHPAVAVIGERWTVAGTGIYKPSFLREATFGPPWKPASSVPQDSQVPVLSGPGQG